MYSFFFSCSFFINLIPFLYIHHACFVTLEPKAIESIALDPIGRLTAPSRMTANGFVMPAKVGIPLHGLCIRRFPIKSGMTQQTFRLSSIAAKRRSFVYLPLP